MDSRPLCEVSFRLYMLKQHSKLQYDVKVHYNEGLWKHCTVMKQLREALQILCANHKQSIKQGKYPMTMRLLVVFSGLCCFLAYPMFLLGKGSLFFCKY